MLQFTIFTLFMSILWVSFFVKLISLLRKQMSYLNYFSIYPLLILLTFCILRLILPVEFPFTKVINSYEILPFIQSLLCYTLLKFGLIELNIVNAFTLTWILGTILNIYNYIRHYSHFRQLLNFIPETTKKHLYDVFFNTHPKGFLINVKIIVQDSVQSPAIFGFIKPVILLPSINFNDDELLGIFIHETAHHQYGHAIIKLLVELIRAFFWWNPFFKELSSEISHALEMQSDKAVCKILTFNQQKIYLTCVANIADNILPFSTNITCNLLEEINSEKLKQRFEFILNKSYKRKQKYNFLILPILISMFLLSYSIVLQPYSLPDVDDIGVRDEINPNQYLIETADGYKLYDSNNVFISNIKYIDKSLSCLKIYKNLEEIECEDY